MARTIYDWSFDADENDTAGGDAINWREGMKASAVNNSARAMMAELARFRDDIAGGQTTGGTATAHTLTARASFTQLENGRVLAFKAGATNTNGMTLNVNGLGARLVMKNSTSGLAPVSAGDVRAGGSFVVRYDEDANEGNGAWVLQNPITAPVPVDTYRFTVDKLADVAAIIVPGESNGLFVNRYDASAFPRPAFYRRVAAQPTHLLRAQDATGQWFEIAEPIIDAAMAGATYDTVTPVNDAAAIQRAVTAAGLTCKRAECSRLAYVETTTQIMDVQNVDRFEFLHSGFLVGGGAGDALPIRYFNMVNITDEVIIDGRGHAVDHVVVPWAQTTVHDIGADYVDFALHDGYSVAGWTFVQRVHIMDPDTKEYLAEPFDNSGSPCSITSLGGGIYRVADGLTPGDFTIGQSCVLYNIIRRTTAARLINVKKARLRDTDFYALPGIIKIARSCGSIIEEGWNCVYKPMSDRWISCHAGGAGNCGDKYIVRNCIREGMGDDCTAAGGQLASITSVDSTTQLTLDLIHTQLTWKVGERCIFINNDMEEIGDYRTITNIVTVSGTTVEVTFDAALDGGVTTSVFLVNLDQMPKYVEIKGCKLGPAYGHGAIIMAPEMNVENNIIEKCRLGGVRLNPYNVIFDLHGRPIRPRVTFNKVRRCGRNTGFTGATLPRAAIELKPVAKNNTITQTSRIVIDPIIGWNEISDCEMSAIHVFRCLNAIVIGNALRNVCSNPHSTSPSEPSFHPIWANRCEGLRISGNSALGAGGSGAISINNTTDWEVFGNAGLIEPINLIPWTPVPQFATNGDAVLTVTASEAYRWKVGPKEWRYALRVTFDTNAYTPGGAPGPVGRFQIAGFPLTAINTSTLHFGAHVVALNLPDIAANRSVYPYFQENSSVIEILTSNAGITAVISEASIGPSKTGLIVACTGTVIVQ